MDGEDQRKAMMTKEQIIRGIETYNNEQAEILQAIKDHNGKLTQHEFDKVFGDEYNEIDINGVTKRVRKPPKIKFWPCSGKAFLLGSMITPSDWAKYLHLTQLMCCAGLLTAKEEDSLVVYRQTESKGTV
jgi:hypothetical protein